MQGGFCLMQLLVLRIWYPIDLSGDHVYTTKSEESTTTPDKPKEQATTNQTPPDSDHSYQTKMESPPTQPSLPGMFFYHRYIEFKHNNSTE